MSRGKEVFRACSGNTPALYALQLPRFEDVRVRKCTDNFLACNEPSCHWQSHGESKCKVPALAYLNMCSPRVAVTEGPTIQPQIAWSTARREGDESGGARDT